VETGIKTAYRLGRARSAAGVVLQSLAEQKTCLCAQGRYLGELIDFGRNLGGEEGQDHW
jgi:hypothetical protein